MCDCAIEHDISRVCFIQAHTTFETRVCSGKAVDHRS